MQKTVEEQELERRLHADVEHLKAFAQAEGDWARCFADRANPWTGAGARLKAAEDALTANEDRERRKSFECLIQRYEDALAEVRNHEATPERVRAIEAEQRSLNGIDLLRRGVHLRTGPITNEQDKLDRENVAKWKELEDQRIRLANACNTANARRATMELENPWLRDLGKVLDAKVPAAA